MKFPIHLFGKKDIDQENNDENMINNDHDDSNDNNINSEDNSNNNSNNDNNNDNNSNGILPSNVNILNRINMLNRSQSLPNSPRRHRNRSRRLDNNGDQQIRSRHISTSNTNSNNNTTVIDSTNSVLDINSNIMFKHRDSLEDSDNTHSFDPSDFDNNNSIKRTSIARSDSNPWGEDSGFSSSNCLSDEKDDISINASVDLDDNSNSVGVVDKSDSLNSVQQPFPLLSSPRRLRTFSVDSTSSDISDTTSCEVNSNLSSSLPLTYIPQSQSQSQSQTHSHDNDHTTNNPKSLSVSENVNSSSVGVARRKPSRNSRSRRTSTRTTSSSSSSNNNNNNNHITSPTPPPTSQPIISFRQSRSDSNDHNNNCVDFSSKNLYSRVDSAFPFRFADTFQKHGLITLVACICYTMILFFVLGFAAMTWAVIRQCISQSDLKDMRETLLESRRRREITTTTPVADLDGGS